MIRTLSYLCTFLAFVMLAVPAIAQDAATPAAIGVVLDLEGEGNLIMRANEAGQAYPAKINDSVFMNDIIQTGPGAKALIVLVDESRFTLGENARFKIDKYVYDDENPKINHSRYSVMQGVFLYTTGLITKDVTNPDVQITTPYGSIGIRGTTVWGGPIDDDAYSVFVDSGEISFETKRGRIRVVAGEGTTIRNLNSIPERAKEWPTEKVDRAKATVSLKAVEEAKERLATFKAGQPEMLAKHKAYTREKQEIRIQEKNPRDSIKRLNNKQNIPAPLKKSEAEPDKGPQPIPQTATGTIADAVPAPVETPAADPLGSSEPAVPQPVITETPAGVPAPVAEPAPTPAPVPAPAETAPTEPATPPTVTKPKADAGTAPAATPVLADGVQLTAPESKQKPVEQSGEIAAPPPFPRPAPVAQPDMNNLATDPAMRQEQIEKMNLPSAKQHNPL